jgi:hypothetical protein
LVVLLVEGVNDHGPLRWVVLVVAGLGALVLPIGLVQAHRTTRRYRDALSGSRWRSRSLPAPRRGTLLSSHRAMSPEPSGPVTLTGDPHRRRDVGLRPPGPIPSDDQ